MQTITILRGIPASGKSTYAKKIVKENPDTYKRINRDDLRNMFDGYHLSKENEKFVKKIRDVLILEALKSGKNIIVDDTNLSDKNINRIKQLSDIYKKETRNKTEIIIKDFEITLEEALKRDAKRDKPVGATVIKKLHKQFYSEGESDLDGTLAIMNGRNPFDASTCEEDLLNEPIAEIIKTYFDKGTSIILLSGRTDNYKEQTKRWLSKHDIPYHDLLMRKKGDSRKDSVIKQEIVKSKIEGKYFVRFVLDDRNQVVDMWRKDLGFACLQVNYGDF